MELIVVGLNHRTAPVSVREKLAFPRHALGRAFTRLRGVYGIEEALVLSTCNRVEIYACGSSGRLEDQIEEFLSAYHGIKREHFAASLYHYYGADAVRHLFKVSSSLDSMVIGEPEITGQVKEAYRMADLYGMCHKTFHHVFQKSFQTAKRVRTGTQISRGSVSVSSIAVDLAQKIFGSLWGKKALIIGTGKMSGKTARLLRHAGVGRMMVMSRTTERARQAAREFGGQAMSSDGLRETLEQSDIVIASSNAPEFLVKRDMLSDLLPRRRFRSLFFVDLGVPRNVDPAAASLSNVFLYDIDDLAAISEENAQLRRSELRKGLQLVEEKAERVIQWMDGVHGRVEAAV